MREKPIDLQGEIDGLTTTTGDFNTPLSEMDRPNRQKVSKETTQQPHQSTGYN